MANFKKYQVLSKMEQIGMIPVFYHSDADTAKKIVSACAASQSLVVEFTNRGDFADEVFSELIKYARVKYPDLILGIGSVYDAHSAALFIQHGANFIVSPSFDLPMAQLCNLHKIPYIPGCASVTEIQTAHKSGVDIVKLFPGKEAGGPGFVSSVLGPLPHTNIMPTGGVAPTEESLRGWFDAGVVCVGMGSGLIRKELIANNEFDILQQDIKQALALVHKVRFSAHS